MHPHAKYGVRAHARVRGGYERGLFYPGPKTNRASIIIYLFQQGYVDVDIDLLEM